MLSSPLMTFYVTTPIYYVNDTPHIGHAYTTIVADVLARFHRLWGDETYFLTGTDEHGQKVQISAKKHGVPEQQHVDEVVERYKEIWTELGISYDVFMRTSFPFHKKVVQDCLQELFEKGEIYASEYEGWYSVSEEIFYQEKDLVDGKSPIGKEVTRVVEKNYFFRMSKYQQQLIDYIEKNPSYLQPDGKRSEVLGFLRKPLEDLCISRPKARLSWGIELPFDKDFVTYVWFDALLNYVSAIGYRQGAEKEKQFNRLWPSAIHLLGKDILTTHAVYWSTMLMALNTPLPKQIFAHGWWLTESGAKMSKSEGPVVKPLDVKNIVGVDAFRYFLVRDIVFGNDAAFSLDAVVNRVNTELANNLGNLLSRTSNIAEKNFEGKIPEAAATHAATKELIEIAKQTPTKVKARIESLALSNAIEEIVLLLTAANKYLDVIAPWKAVKTDKALAGECIYTALEVVRLAAVLLHPVMPNKTAEILQRIGEKPTPTWADTAQWGQLRSGSPIVKGEPLFPRIENKS